MAKHDFEARGIKIEGQVSLDLKGMMSAKNKSVDQLTGGIEYLFKKNKVEFCKGHGRLIDKNTIEVTDQNNEKKQIMAENIILATGSEVTPFPGVEFDEERIVSSTGALSLDKVPEKLVVIGGGIIGLGAEVTVVEYMDNIGAGMDMELAKQFYNIMQKQGIKFKLGTKVNKVEKIENGVKLEVENLETDVVLISIGRRPFTKDIGLDKVGIEVDDKDRVKIDKEFKTNIPNIRCIGDSTAGPMLAHKAEEEGIACIDFIKNSHGHVNYSCIPSVIYTHPEVAWCGLTEEQIKEQKTPYNVGKFPFSANSRAKTNDEAIGTVKIISHKENDRILGIHIIGPNAGEMIAEGVLAMEYGASSEDIARTCHAHPTLSEAFKEACMAAYDKPIHS